MEADDPQGPFGFRMSADVTHNRIAVHCAVQPVGEEEERQTERRDREGGKESNTLVSVFTVRRHMT